MNIKVSISKFVTCTFFILLVLGGFGVRIFEIAGIGVCLKSPWLSFVKKNGLFTASIHPRLEQSLRFYLKKPGFSGSLNKTIIFPKGVFLYIIFLVILVTSTLWTVDLRPTLEYILLFSSGGLFWIVFYNLKGELRSEIEGVIILLGLTFGSAYLFHRYFQEVTFNTWSLYLPATTVHSHIGDLWAAVLIITTFRFLKDREKNYLSLSILGVYFLIASLSRSAYLALAVGMLYLANKKGWLEKYKKHTFMGAVLMFTIFIFVGLQKTIIFSRPYFVQAILGVYGNPFGIGIGNFLTISQDPVYQVFGITGLSVVTHNIILEVLLGIGVLGVVFIVWLFFVTKEVWSNKKPKYFPAQVIFITLGVNFLFDYTYFIPTMLWLWFAALGISQPSESE
jgi:hypothetical protein